MILRVCNTTQDQQHQESAFDAFLRTQRLHRSTCGLVFQSEHSRLAGALAQALNPDCFGILSAEVITAIAHHDFGWEDSDCQQIDRIESQPPTSFAAISPAETLPCWIRSIAKGYELGSLAAVLISRHCCLLGTGSEKHEAFIADETKRRSELEQTLPYDSDDLDRWTAALGFCDLLSLYLCSGCTSRVSLPLGHPADKNQKQHAVLTWLDGRLCLPKSVLAGPSAFSVSGYSYSKKKVKVSPERLSWIFRSEESK